MKIHAAIDGCGTAGTLLTYRPICKSHPLKCVLRPSLNWDFWTRIWCFRLFGGKSDISTPVPAHILTPLVGITAAMVGISRITMVSQLLLSDCVPCFQTFGRAHQRDLKSIGLFLWSSETYKFYKKKFTLCFHSLIGMFILLNNSLNCLWLSRSHCNVRSFNYR